MPRIDSAPADITSLKRVHVPAERWEDMPGTDFWLLPGIETLTAAGVLLTNNGWSMTAVTTVAGAGGMDFLSSSDRGVPAHFLTNATGDILQSPQVFGSVMHLEAATSILGYAPTRMTMEAIAAFSVASSDEETSGFGFYEAGATISTQADQIAVIVSDGTNFELASGTDTDLGTTISTTWHKWRTEISTGSATDAVEWFIDGTSQGTMNRETDIWPAYFGMHTLTNNRILLGIVHIWYS